MDENTTELNREKLAKIVLPDSRYYFSETDGFDIRIDNIVEIFDEKDNKIGTFSKESINWDNKVIIEYPDNKTYKGKITENGKLNDEHGEIIFFNELEAINRTLSGNFNNGALLGECEIIFDKSDEFKNQTFTGELFCGYDELSKRKCKLTGKGEFTFFEGNIHSCESNFIEGKMAGAGRLTIADKETRGPLYAQIYDENGIMGSIEYVFEYEGNYYKMVVNYDEINRALNRGEINETEDLRTHITLCDKSGNKINNYDIKQYVKQCAKYQLQKKLGVKINEPDDLDNIGNGSTGLQNLIILAELIDNIRALNRARFEIERNDPNWPRSTYNNIESLLNSFGLTMNSPTNNGGILSYLPNFIARYFRLTKNVSILPANNDLTSIDTLLDRGVNYISVNMRTISRGHEISVVIDLRKLKEKRKGFIYVYDSSRIIDDPSKNENLWNLQPYCLIFSRNQQRFGSCWLNSSCSTIVFAENPEIIDEIANGIIIPIKRERPSYFAKFLAMITGSITEFNKSKIPDVEFNNLEIFQMLKLQEVSRDFGIERFGENSTTTGNKPRMIHQIMNDRTRRVIWIKTKKYIEKSVLLSNLRLKFGTYMILNVMTEERRLSKNNTASVKNVNSEEETNNLVNEEVDEEGKVAVRKQREIINKKLKELNAKNLEEVDKKLLDRFKETVERNGVDEKSLEKATKELELLSPVTRLELLKRIDKQISKELWDILPLQLSEKIDRP